MLSVEHRAAPAPEPLALVLAGEDDVHLEIATVAQHQHNNSAREPHMLDNAIRDALTQSNEPLPRAELRARLHVRNERIGEALTRLATSGVVLRVGDRWTIPDSHSP